MKSESDVNKKTGERVRTCIYENFKNQAEFARVTGFSSANIACICNGQRKLTTDNARAFAKLFGVRMEYLLGEDDFKTEEDAEAYNKKLYAEPFAAMNEHERSISARQLVLYDMVLPWLLQLYDIEDIAEDLTLKEYFKLAEYLDHELQHIIQSYFNVRSGEFVNPINTKSDAELFERYTRDCLEELRKINCFNIANYSMVQVPSFATHGAYSYGVPFISELLYTASKEERGEWFEKSLNWFNTVRKYCYSDNSQAAAMFFRESSIMQALEFVKSEHRFEVDEMLQDLFFSDNLADIAYLEFDFEEVEEVIEDLYHKNFFIDSMNLDEIEKKIIGIFQKLYDTVQNATSTGITWLKLGE